MTDLTLLVMAAGTGTRYGGLKQIDPVGPNGEALMDYSIFDALRVGFTKVVLVIRRSIEDDIRASIGSRIEKEAQVSYIFQDETSLVGPTVASGRTKPWGTAHAILSAAEAISEPFAVINADDYYGVSSFGVLSRHLRQVNLDSALVGFSLRRTLSDHGPVKRGLCVVSHDTLQSVTELEGLEADSEGVHYLDHDGVQRNLTGDEIVSMNMWGFRPTILPAFHEQWGAFRHSCVDSEISEFTIPDVVTDLINSNKTSCQVLRTDASWFGVTYHQDKSLAVRRIQDLIRQGLYSEDLWSAP